MAHIEKHPRSPYWSACFKDADGKRKRCSTKTRDKREAQRMADEWEDAYRGKVKAHQYIDVMSGAYQRFCGSELKRYSVREYFAQCLNQKNTTVAGSTLTFYEQACRRFLEWLGDAADRPLPETRREVITNYRNQLAAQLAAKTVNQNLKVLRMVFSSALRDRAAFEDPTEGVALVKQSRQPAARQDFTLEELKRTIAAAPPEWRGMIRFGLYTGQRLGDLARLTWRNVKGGELHLTTSKTGRSQILPIHPAMQSYLATLPAPHSGAAPLFPAAFEAVQRAKGQSATLSNQFADILAAAGLREPVAHNTRKQTPEAAFAEFYGTTLRNVQKWIQRGAAGKDPCPLSTPSAMPAWWKRCYLRPVPEGMKRNAGVRSFAPPPGERTAPGGRGSRRVTSALSFHSLRHTATSMMKAAGVPHSVVQDYIGHDDAAMSRHYTHTGKGPMQEASAALPEI